MFGRREVRELYDRKQTAIDTTIHQKHLEGLTTRMELAFTFRFDPYPVQNRISVMSWYTYHHPDHAVHIICPQQDDL